jgi:hypothetical protein
MSDPFDTPMARAARRRVRQIMASPHTIENKQRQLKALGGGDLAIKLVVAETLVELNRQAIRDLRKRGAA